MSPKTPENTGVFAITLLLAGWLFSGAATAAAPPTNLSAALIRGVTAYGPSELFPVYRDQLGQPINTENVKAIVKALQDLYARDGYSRPRMSLDQKRVSRGILAIDVSETRITGVIISGEPGPYRSQLEKLGAQLSGMQPVKQQEVQRVLRQMRELPGLTVTAATKQDESLRNGYAIAVETVFKPVTGEVRMNNRGSEEIGGSFALGRLTFNSLFGHGEKLGFLLSSAADFEGYHGGGLFADLPVGPRRTRVMATGLASRSNPREIPNDRHDLYLRDRATLRVFQPLLAEATRTLSLYATLDMNNLRIEREQALLREDRLRVAELGSSYGWRTAAGTQYLATLEARHGFDSFGSRLYAPDLTHDLRRNDFLLTRMQFIRLAPLGERWTLRFDAFGQYSDHVLPYDERFKIGGARLARGLEVPEIAGDRGAGAKAELRFQLTPSSHRLGKTSLYGFCDTATAWKQDRPGSESASTSGLGVAFQHKRAVGYVEVAQAIDYPRGVGSTSPTVFAEVSFPF